MQPELFQELEGAHKQKRFQPPLFPNGFLRIRIAYEDVIFAALSLILILLAGFCIGVEKGKHLLRNSQEIPTAVVPSLKVKEVLPQKIEAVAEESHPVTKNGENYVIQAASFVDNGSAQVERERLVRKGFNAQVISATGGSASGGKRQYFELRVVGYHSRNEAQLSLTNLKRVYRDSFVKRLS